MAAKKRRADELLLEKLNLESLELARALIMEGRALSGDSRITGAAQLLKEDAPLRVKGVLNPYVSRGAHKLKKALEVFDLSVKDRCCLDSGCSTGGFTDVMLRAGARRVYALDVGYNLLDYRIRSDDRVTVMERTNARFITPADFPESPSFAATDVSFISLKAILPAAFSVLTQDARFVALIKPQFEAPKELVGEKGVVRDPAVHFSVVQDIVRFVDGTGWHAQGLDFSPITGPEGNIEFLLLMAPGHVDRSLVNDGCIETTIRSAYDKIFKSVR